MAGISSVRGVSARASVSSLAAPSKVAGGGAVGAVTAATPVQGADSVTERSVAPASSQVDLSPAAQFLSTVARSRERLEQLKRLQGRLDAAGAPYALSAAGQTADQVAALHDAAQDLVDAFNRLPATDLNQAQAAPRASLLNNLVQGLTAVPAGAGKVGATAAVAPSAGNATGGGTEGAAVRLADQLASQLAGIGVTLQPPLLGDKAGGVSLDTQQLRSAFERSGDHTAAVLHQALDTADQVARDFDEHAGADQPPAALAALPVLDRPAILTAAESQANQRLDHARAEILEQVRIAAANPPDETCHHP